MHITEISHFSVSLFFYSSVSKIPDEQITLVFTSSLYVSKILKGASIEKNINDGGHLLEEFHAQNGTHFPFRPKGMHSLVSQRGCVG